MWYHRKNKHLKIGKQRWHLALAPRGGGKTTILTIASIILDVLKNPNIRILIASKTDKNGVDMLSEIKKKFESKKLITLFGPQIGDVWNDGEINVKARTATHKEKTISTVGVGSALASRHFDKIYADDLVDEFNSTTDGQREKIVIWFDKILDPTLMPDGEISIVGTRYHFADLYGQKIDKIFIKKNKKGKVIKRYYIRIPSLMKRRMPYGGWPKGTRKWDKFVSFWPEEFTVKFLLKKRCNVGSIVFNSQMQNDVEGMKGKIFKFDWFNWYKLEDINISELLVFQGVDLAISKKDDADKFAHCTIGIHPKTKNIYILDYFNRIVHYTFQKKLIKDRNERFDPIRVGIESNGYQKSLLEDMQVDDELSKIRAIPVFTDTDKTVRAWKLSAYFERGQVFLQEGMYELQEHLLKMPDGRYKDLFDALDIAVNTAFNKKRKVRDSEPGVI
jgi:phage terminase large subunit-like protein